MARVLRRVMSALQRGYRLTGTDAVPWPLFGLAVLACTGAAPVSCPSSLPGSVARHRLVDASLFDGPPKQEADLVPVPAGAVERWNLDGVDPYLVCRFRGTSTVVTIHAAGARSCKAGGSPFAASCRD